MYKQKCQLTSRANFHVYLAKLVVVVGNRNFWNSVSMYERSKSKFQGKEVKIINYRNACVVGHC